MNTPAPSYLHRGGEEPLRGQTIDAAFRQSVMAFAQHEALISLPQQRRLTYEQLDKAVDTVAKGLLALEIAKGDRVGIWSTNNVEWVLLQLATARVGAILVNINPAYRPEELAYALQRAEVQALFLIPTFRRSHYIEMLLEICPALGQQTPEALVSEALPTLKHVVLYDPDQPDKTERPASGFLCWQEFLAAGRATPPEALASRAQSLDPDDPINIQFTSGTTGAPKAVLLTHHNILNNAVSISRIMRFGPQDRLCVPVPFYHCFGMVVSNLVCFACGAAIVIPAPHFDPEATLDAISQERCSALHGVPTMFIAVLEAATASDLPEDLALRTGIMAGAPCPPEVMRRVIDQLGCHELLIAYGQTEASPVTHMTRPHDDFQQRIETVGTNLPHQETKVVDTETGAIVPRGQAGEICFRGYHVMHGYYGQPEATHNTIDANGWLHSGDLGVMDEHGYLKITGRLKDMIIRGGENIYPAEIEAVFYKHPAIEEACVFGIPDDRMGEEVGAWLKLRTGQKLDAQDARAYIQEHLAHFKVPRHVWFVDAFPMTVTGKIQKFRVREQASQWLNNDKNDEEHID